MEKYYRMVINLYREAVQHKVNADNILIVRKEIACAITAARINNQDTHILTELEKEVRNIENLIV